MQDSPTVDRQEVLVIAMTRPSMLSGLTFGSIGVSFFVPGMAAMVTRSVWFFALIPIFLFISYLVCLKDVYLFDVFESYTYLKTGMNRSHWRCRSYAPR